MKKLFIFLSVACGFLFAGFRNADTTDSFFIERNVARLTTESEEEISEESIS